MLTKSQRDALAQAIKALQAILDEDTASYYTPKKKKYRRGSAEQVQETRRTIVSDYRSGASVKSIADKYNLRQSPRFWRGFGVELTRRVALPFAVSASEPA